MTFFQYLHQQDPFWIWLGVSALFVALNLATGLGLLMWPAAAAAAVAALELAGVRLGLGVETGVFAALTLAAFAVLAYRRRRPVVAAPAPAPAAGPSAPSSGTRATGSIPRGRRAPGDPGQSARLVGRIGRTTGEFANGVGRVWIDGAEWAAELDAGEAPLPEGAPVRISRVIGGVRLLVHPLAE